MGAALLRPYHEGMMTTEELTVIAQELEDLRQDFCGLRLMLEALEMRVARLEGPGAQPCAPTVTVSPEDLEDCASYTDLMLE